MPNDTEKPVVCFTLNLIRLQFLSSYNPSYNTYKKQIGNIVHINTKQALQGWYTISFFDKTLSQNNNESKLQWENNDPVIPICFGEKASKMETMAAGIKFWKLQDLKQMPHYMYDAVNLSTGKIHPRKLTPK